MKTLIETPVTEITLPSIEGNYYTDLGYITFNEGTKTWYKGDEQYFPKFWLKEIESYSMLMNQIEKLQAYAKMAPDSDKEYREGYLKALTNVKAIISEYLDEPYSKSILFPTNERMRIILESPSHYDFRNIVIPALEAFKDELKQINNITESVDPIEFHKWCIESHWMAIEYEGKTVWHNIHKDCHGEYHTTEDVINKFKQYRIEQLKLK